MKRATFPLKGKTVPFSFGSVRLSAGVPGASVVVSKKTFPKAVLRNKLRRRTYAALRPLFRAGAMKGRAIIYPNRSALSAPLPLLSAALRKILR